MFEGRTREEVVNELSIVEVEMADIQKLIEGRGIQDNKRRMGVIASSNIDAISSKIKAFMDRDFN